MKVMSLSNAGLSLEVKGTFHSRLLCMEDAGLRWSLAEEWSPCKSTIRSILRQFIARVMCHSLGSEANTKLNFVLLMIRIRQAT